MPSRHHAEDGFTLTEVMVAAVVLVVGVLGLATLADVANQMASKANDRSGATSLARRVAESARSLTTGQLTSAGVLAAVKAATPSLPDSNPADAAWTV